MQVVTQEELLIQTCLKNKILVRILTGTSITVGRINQLKVSASFLSSAMVKVGGYSVKMLSC